MPERGWKHRSPSPGTTPHPEQSAVGEEDGVEEGGKVFQVLQELSLRMELGMQSGKEQGRWDGGH